MGEAAYAWTAVTLMYVVVKGLTGCRYHSKGGDATRELFNLYCRMLWPVFLVSLWMFAMFAFTSYMVPNVFCKSTVISSQVTPLSPPLSISCTEYNNSQSVCFTKEERVHGGTL